MRRWHGARGSDIDPPVKEGAGVESKGISPELVLPLRALLANAPLVLFALDQDGIFIASEGAGLRALGLDRGEVVGRSVFDVYAEAPQILGMIKRALQGESLKWVAEVAGTWWETHAEPLRDESGRMLGIVGLATDATERQRAVEEMLETEERFRKLADAAFEAIAIHEHGKILVANQALAEMFQYEPRELIGMSVLELAAPESRALIAAHVQRGFEEAYEAGGQRKDGSCFPAELRARSIKYRGRPMRVTAVRDLTAHKRAEAALHDKVRALDGLLGTAAEKLETMTASSSASLSAERSNELREVLRLVERARDVTGGASPVE